MKIWICIPVFNRVEFTFKCIESLRLQKFISFVVVICDHGSTDNTAEIIHHSFPEVVVLSAPSTLWWTGAMNRCVEYVLHNAEENDCLLTLNNDTELPPDYLAEFYASNRMYPNAVLTSTIHDICTGKPHGSAGYRQNWLTAKAEPVGFENSHLSDDLDVVEVSHASGRGTLYPIAVFRQIGLFDESHLPHYGADYDFSHKARRAGYPIYVCRNCRVFSHVEATGMTVVRNRFSLKSFFNYFKNIKSPANLRVRWWYGWNNCPRFLFPTYIMLDVLRITGSYFRYFLTKDSGR